MRSDDAMTHDAAIGQGDYYTIPFRSLIPADVSNLMFAGRILSADPVAFASVRGMPQCMAMGQATGTAAALALAAGSDVQSVDTGALVGELTRQGINRLATTKVAEPA
jgi:tetrahydromethanopterin S-methyltransferase subunit D